jgi:hypothetical protein
MDIRHQTKTDDTILVRHGFSFATGSRSPKAASCGIRNVLHTVALFCRNRRRVMM